MGAETFGKAMHGKRTVKRARVLLNARLETSSATLEARLRDLSQRGALIECTERLEIDSEVVFSRGGTRVPARVAWVSGKRVGLEFLRPIQESEVLRQLERCASPAPVAPQVPYKRPGLRTHGLTEEERKLAEVWGISVGLAVPD